MNTENFNIRTMYLTEVNMAVDWAAEQGWNTGLHDAETFFAADNNGFFIGLIDNKPIAAISAVKYGTSYGFIGLFIVQPEYRGRQYGFQMGGAALQYLSGRNIGIDGVVEQQDNYKKSGFKMAHRNIRYEWKGNCTAYTDSRIVELSTLPFNTINIYDQDFFPDNRSTFIQSWIKQADSFALGIIDNGKLSGYGVIRACRTGYKIGPLFANTPELADSLFLSLTSKIKPTNTVFIDMPEPNASALALAESHKMKMCFETAKMYSQSTPAMPLDRIYGLTSFEVG